MFGFSFLALSVDHEVSNFYKEDKEFLKFKEECTKTGTTEEAIAVGDKIGFKTSLFAKNPLNPDRKHIHHLLKNYLQIFEKFSHQKASIISGLIINILILVFGFISIHFYQNKYILIFNIILFSVLYTIFYFIIYNKCKNIKL